jgi:hypothetical protein
MINSKIDRATDGRFEIGLIIGGDFLGANILPFELVAHPAATEDGHLQLCLAKSAVFHAA